MPKAKYLLAEPSNELFEPGHKLRVHFHCPGCGRDHFLCTAEANHYLDGEKGPIWGFNGDMDKPTFTPSILTTLPWHNEDGSVTNHVCHSFVTDGKIQFLNDCTHQMAGQTVELPEME